MLTKRQLEQPLPLPLLPSWKDKREQEIYRLPIFCGVLFMGCVRGGVEEFSVSNNEIGVPGFRGTATSDATLLCGTTV